MSAAATRVALRSAAILIAIAALLDPVFSIGRTPAAPVVLINLTSSSISEVGARVRSLMPDVEVSAREASGHRLPCQPGERCVVVADGSRDATLPADLTTALSVIRNVPADSPNVAVRSVILPGAQHAASAGAADVVLDGRGVAGRRTEIRLTDGDAIVGSAAHEWQRDGEATVRVPWWPMATGPRAIRVHAVKFDDERIDFDNTVDAGVSIEPGRVPVLVFDSRPSWSSTFVRRALEDDPRFQVEYRARLAPAIAAGTANGRLDAAALANVPVLVAGAPDALTAAEVDVIDRYVRSRGGSVILLPERPPSGAASRLFAGRWQEQLHATPESVGPLSASETLSTAEVSLSATVLGRTARSAAIVMTPVGHGQVIVSGAMDAWRYRDAGGGAFDRFWRSLVAEAAAAGASVQVEFERGVAPPGSRQRFQIRQRRMQPAAVTELSAVGRCANAGAQAIRAWPDGPDGFFSGELPIGDAGPCTIEVSAGDDRASAGIAVMAAPAAGGGALATLEREVRASGGVVADAADLQPIATHRAAAGGAPQATPVHPMRSPWWLVPFAGALAIDWWLRRRGGLR